jgi:hypothetical protein
VKPRQPGSAMERLPMVPTPSDPQRVLKDETTAIALSASSTNRPPLEEAFFSCPRSSLTRKSQSDWS